METQYQTVTSNKTIKYYESIAESFWQNTKDHDVNQNYVAFLSAMNSNEKLSILDFGCGPGRDVLYFKELNHHVIGLDGTSEFCQMARNLTGCTILQQDFLSLNLEKDSFNGIFANASLFHIPSEHLERVLKELQQALKAGGILFSSNPRGDHEGWNGERFGFYIEFDKYKEFLDRAGMKVLSHYYRPQGLPKEQQPWLAVVAQKK